MPTFSERYGYTPVREQLQVNDVDDGLTTALYNVLYEFYMMIEISKYRIGNRSAIMTDSIIRGELGENIWKYFYNYRIDKILCREDLYDFILENFFELKWYSKLDLLEFISDYYYKAAIDFETIDLNRYTNDFQIQCNRAFSNHNSGFRYINSKITPITNEQEIQSIEQATQTEEDNVNDHINQALTLYADRENPDYRNSVKESISAVECLVMKLTSKSKFSDATTELVKSGIIEHKALKKSLDSLYGYASDEDGIRHPIMDKDTVTAADAKFMLVQCSAFVNYLMEKKGN